MKQLLQLLSILILIAVINCNDVTETPETTKTNTINKTNHITNETNIVTNTTNQITNEIEQPNTIDQSDLADKLYDTVLYTNGAIAYGNLKEDYTWTNTAMENLILTFTSNTDIFFNRDGTLKE